MNQTLKTHEAGLHIQAALVQELGIDAQGEVEVRREGHTIVVEVARPVRLQRLAEDLDRLIARNAEALAQLSR